MPPSVNEPDSLRIGIDVGGTFTDLVCFDPLTGRLDVIKLPSTPPDFHRAVIDAARQAVGARQAAHIINGSTVATNALLNRSGEPCAFVTTEGFRDMLLIGRQNRPAVYALHVVRPEPLAADENCFTIRERIDAAGTVVEALSESEVDRLIDRITSRGLRQVAVCLLFSFVNPAHEAMIGRRCAEAGLMASLSSQVLPEFREYERASTTVINAYLGPAVRRYLQQLRGELPAPAEGLRIMHSGGGTLSLEDASASAARLVLSGPAGGVLGAAFVAAQAGVQDAITYDMGGTSTDVAVILDGRPQWTTGSTIDGLPIGLPALDIHTVGAGGGSVAYLDAGGALRVGPRSAGAFPGPACYGRGATEPTVTDANLLLGRILPERFAGGAMRVDPDSARSALAPLAAAMGKPLAEAALGIVRVAENNMSRAIRAVTSTRGLDPRRLALLSFGGAGGLHACALAQSLDIGRVLVPPLSGVLSALGMVIAPAVADASKTVVHLSDALDDDRLAAEYGLLSGRTMDEISFEQTGSIEVFADVRFQGQSHELVVRVNQPSREHIRTQFLKAYARRYGTAPGDRSIQIVTLRVRRSGRPQQLRLPAVPEAAPEPLQTREVTLNDGRMRRVRCFTRPALRATKVACGPALVIDDQATTFVPPDWDIAVLEDGSLLLERSVPASTGEGAA